MEPLTVDARAPEAGTALHPSYYLDPELQEREQRADLRAHLAARGPRPRLPEPGTYITAQAGNQPVLVVRGEDGELRAFRNVCRHRGSRLLSGEGTCKAAIRCRYHGWTYGLDGSLIGVPGGARVRRRPRQERRSASCRRASRSCAASCSSTSTSTPTPLAEQVGDLPQRLERYEIPSLVPFDPERRRPSRPTGRSIADNYLEGYHIPIAHPGLMRLLDYKRYEADIHENYVWFEAPMRDEPCEQPARAPLPAARASRCPGSPTEDLRVWRYVFIYPNTTIDLYPDQVDTGRSTPDERGPDRATTSAATARRTAGCAAAPPSGSTSRLNDLVGDEDIDLVRQRAAGARDAAATAAGRCRGARPRVAWFADRVRADLAAEL